MNLVITSEHRVGSRWLHYLLADILDKGVSPEREGTPVGVIKSSAEVVQFLSTGRIAKYHHGTRESIERGLSAHPNLNYKIIAMVRNPRDRAASKAFHDYYHPKHNYSVKNHAKTDFEAVKWTVNSEPFIDDNWRQLELMENNYSTRNYKGDGKYIWTSYEWMKDDAGLEVSHILRHLGIILPGEYDLDVFIEKHSFKKRSGGREAGQEERKDNWRRKGMMLDWINWFDLDMVEDTQAIQEEYWKKLITNGGQNG